MYSTLLMRYMTLHRRFDLVRDYGCFASSHPSTAAFLVLWLPPLLLSGAALAMAGLTIHNIGRIRGTTFATHVVSRSSMNSSMIVRKLSTCMAVAISLILIRLASLFTINSFQQWTSLSDVHRLIFKVQVMELPEDVTKALFDWWSFFAISVLYLGLTFILGEETRDIYRFIIKQFQKKRKFPSLNLPLYKSKREPTSNLKRLSLTSALSTSFGWPKLRPLGFEFKSGWDDTLDEKNITRFKNSRIDKPPSPTRTSSPTPSDKSTTDEDKALIISTLSYLGSPTARTLEITLPTEMQLPSIATLGSSSKQPPSPPTSSIILEPMIRAMPVAYVPVDVEPGHERELNIKSVLNAHWPVPPASPSPSLSHYSTSSTTHSRSDSSASSPAAAEESFKYSLYPTITPPN